MHEWIGIWVWPVVVTVAPFIVPLLWRRWQERDRRAAEKELAQLNAPDYLEIQKSRMWRWLSLAAYFASVGLTLHCWDEAGLRKQATLVGFLAAMSAARAITFAVLIDPRRTKSRQQFLERKL